MAKMKRAEITIKSVAWSDDKVLKVQAFARYGNVSVIGDPAKNDGDALKSLRKELAEYRVGIPLMIEALSKMEEQTDELG